MPADPAEWMDDYHQMLCDAERVEAANDEMNLINTNQGEDE